MLSNVFLMSQRISLSLEGLKLIVSTGHIDGEGDQSMCLCHSTCGQYFSFACSDHTGLSVVAAETRHMTPSPAM